MPGQPVQIGGFVGGLNNISTSGEARDNEVVELINMEVNLDTSLTSRPPIEAIGGTFISQPNGWEVLGVYRLSSDTWYLIVEKPTGATTWDLLAYPSADFTASPITIKSITGTNNKIVSMVQYNDYVYFNLATGATDRVLACPVALSAMTGRVCWNPTHGRQGKRTGVGRFLSGWLGWRIRDSRFLAWCRFAPKDEWFQCPERRRSPSTVNFKA